MGGNGERSEKEKLHRSLPLENLNLTFYLPGGPTFGVVKRDKFVGLDVVDQG